MCTVFKQIIANQHAPRYGELQHKKVQALPPNNKECTIRLNTHFLHQSWCTETCCTIVYYHRNPARTQIYNELQNKNVQALSPSSVARTVRHTLHTHILQHTKHICRVGHNCIYTPCMTVCLVIPPAKNTVYTLYIYIYGLGQPYTYAHTHKRTESAPGMVYRNVLYTQCLQR